MIDDGPSPSYELLDKADRRRQQRDAALARVAELEVELKRLRIHHHESVAGKYREIMQLRAQIMEHEEGPRDYRLLRDAVLEWFNPPDQDIAEPAIMEDAIKQAGQFIESVPCSCPEGASTYDVLPCKRCQALGRVADKPEEY